MHAVNAMIGEGSGSQGSYGNRSRDGPGKSVFVTVGTTSFEKLVQTVDTLDVQETLAALGFDKVTYQIGGGVYVPRTSSDDRVGSLKAEWFRLKGSIRDEIEKADLVISHGGAGSILETLDVGRPLVVVINEDLMTGHQTELAEKLFEEHHLYFCTCRTLKQTLLALNGSSPCHLKPLPAGKPDLFTDFLDDIIGLT